VNDILGIITKDKALIFIYYTKYYLPNA